MNDKEYFFNLYELARQLNKEFSKPSALYKALEKIVEILNLETGWIWLAEKDLKSVYLAASFNLPPALRDHPERLSGWCYCIGRYFSDNIDEATNISEITCSRLKDVSSGTRDLKFHATIPITINDQKIGLINLLSKKKQQLDDKQLSVLNVISELIGTVIQRTHLQDAYAKIKRNPDNDLNDIIKRVVVPRIEELINLLDESETNTDENNYIKSANTTKDALRKTKELKKQIALIIDETSKEANINVDEKEFRYPSSPLTHREMEILAIIKKGHTNKQIGEQLFISQSTVKFHITSIMSKLYAKTRTQAVDIALKKGLLNS
ncbi:LuxR C-terminal-related transcriptional regulator [Muriicola sp. Z0-33]|uniref:LuxR C-terminal-related transcriptional regulator n=1 Tax=Muriicola sp. Z0-33 TaxID=2816957 RepID=UPI002A04DF1F|nr:LuxR C-terminal-related transcriptional regulator [Muriicola sp. Z0-33]MCW5516940.1 GAF domain-containing protein [Muriicola sp. Z0-33]